MPLTYSAKANNNVTTYAVISTLPNMKNSLEAVIKEKNILKLFINVKIASKIPGFVGGVKVVSNPEITSCPINDPTWIMKRKNNVVPKINQTLVILLSPFKGF